MNAVVMNRPDRSFAACLAARLELTMDDVPAELTDDPASFSLDIPNRLLQRYGIVLRPVEPASVRRLDGQPVSWLIAVMRPQSSFLRAALVRTVREGVQVAYDPFEQSGRWLNRPDRLYEFVALDMSRLVRVYEVLKVLRQFTWFQNRLDLADACSELIGEPLPSRHEQADL